MSLGIFVTTYRRGAAGRWRSTERRCTSWREVLPLVRYADGARVRVGEAGGVVFVEVGI